MQQAKEMTSHLNGLNWQFFVQKKDGTKYPLDDVTCMDLMGYLLAYVDTEQAEYISSIGYKF